MELVIVVQVQSYSGDEEEKECLEKIRDAIVSVVALADLSVGTFTVSDIRSTEEQSTIYRAIE